MSYTFTGSETANTLISGTNIDTSYMDYRKKTWKSANYWYHLTYNNDSGEETIFRSQALSSWTEITLPTTDGTYNFDLYYIFVTSNDVIHAICQAKTISLPRSYKLRYGTYNGSWSWQDVSLPVDDAVVPTIVLDSSGYAHVVIEINNNIYYSNNTSGSWSSWYNIPNYASGNGSIYNLGITANDNIYSFCVEDNVGVPITVCHIRSGGSWSSTGFSDAGIESCDVAWNGNNVYFFYTVYNTAYLIHGSGTSLIRETIDNGSGSGFFIEYFYGSVAVCNDGTNTHMMYIVQDLTGYPSVSIDMHYVYGTTGNYTYNTMSNNPYTSSYPTYSSQGFYGDTNRLIYMCSGASQQFYFLLGNGDATHGEDPDPDPTTAGGRFYYYNASQSTFKLARNIKYNDSGTYRIGRKLMDYGSEDGWKRVRF